MHVKSIYVQCIINSNLQETYPFNSIHLTLELKPVREKKENKREEILCYMECFSFFVSTNLLSLT